MQGERVASVFAMIFYQNHTDWTCKHTLEGVTPWAAVRIFLWMTNSTLETHFFRPRQSAVLVNHARQHSTTFCSHLQHRICCFVSDGPPTERTVCSPPPQTLEWGLAHSQLSKLFCRLVNGTQPMGKSLTDNKACVSREPLQTHSALQWRHLWHLTKLPEKKYINMEWTKPTTRTLPDGSVYSQCKEIL